MDDHYTPIISEEERKARHAARAQARRRKLRARRLQQLRQTLPIVAICLVLIGALSAWAGNKFSESEDEDLPAEPAGVPAAKPMAVTPDTAPTPEPAVFTPIRDGSAVTLGADFPSGHAIVLDLQSGKVLAQKDADTVLSPASMTKILTLLVAAEHLTAEDMNQMVPITREITDYCYVNGCSVVGLMVGESVPVLELLYGTILSSGADAALALANYVAGSHEAFVELMNQKLEELGLSDTAHFTNCVGIYDDAHHCTVSDIAVILRAAMENELCSKVLDARTYETKPTSEHPGGQVLSNWFLRRIEDKDTGDIRVIGAKTGYVVQAGNCAASCGEDPDGNRYICVTADGNGPWGVIYDHVALYSTYCK